MDGPDLSHLGSASRILDLAKHYSQIPHKRRDVGKAQIGVYVLASRAVVNEADGGKTGLSSGEDVVT